MSAVTPEASSEQQPAAMAQNGSALPPAIPSTSKMADGAMLTGKQEHCMPALTPSFFSKASQTQGIAANTGADLKRELISQQVKEEITELNSPTALERFGAPFKSEFGEVSPLDSELPILRYIFVHHVREFPFLDKAKEKEFWQDKLQVVSLPIPLHV
jgi:hypothetical protein